MRLGTAGTLFPRTLAGSRLPDLVSAAEWARLVHVLGLAPQEARVLHGAFYDERYGAIAGRLRIKQSTVHTYCQRLLLKLGIKSLTQAVSFAVAVHVELAAEASTRPQDPVPRLVDLNGAAPAELASLPPSSIIRSTRAD